MRDYDFDGLGLCISGPNGSVYIQGEEGAELFDDLEEIEDSNLLDSVLSAYDHVCS